MSRNAKRGVVATVIVALVGAAGIYALVGTRAAATAQAMADVGRFRVGSALGEERSGFSGRAKVLVFTSASSPDWPAISTCLGSVEVSSVMDFFTGVLVDEALEPTVEATLRERDGLRVVVRGLNGAFLGGLAGGFTCKELLDLLGQVRAVSTRAPEPSPIYATLLESTAALDDLIAAGDTVKAERYVALLEELEGSASPAVQAAKAKVGK